jgi:hypothetical protein
MNSHISKDKYYYNKDVKIEAYEKQIEANVYGITLTNEEYKNLVVAVLNEILQNDMILNVILQKVEMFKLQTDITTSDIQTFIQNEIQKINTKGFESGIKIEFYESNGKLVRTRNRNSSK